MSSNTILRKLPSGFEKTFISDSSAALARSHRLIRIEHQKECTFMSICAQIKLDEFRENRSTNQREQRRQKRKKYQIS
jgi:hypothetical protein